MRVLVSGANRGIGLELARQLLSRGDRVDAAVRDPDHATQLRALAPTTRLVVHRCDVCDPAAVAALGHALADVALDAVIHNAGQWGDHQTLGDLDFHEAARLFEVNALAALRVTLAVLPALRRGHAKKLIAITSGLGSIGDNTSGGNYGYRMAKAALNMAIRTLSIDLRSDRIACAVIDPGWVQTDMGGPRAPTPVADSVRGIIARFDELTLDETGHCWSWRGGRRPW